VRHLGESAHDVEAHVARAAFEADVAEERLEPRGECLAVTDDLPDAAMAAVYQRRERQQVRGHAVELRPGGDDQVDEAELRGATCLRSAEVGDEGSTSLREDLADRGVGRRQVGLRVEA
jgi:hypothetical protein